MKKTVNLKTLWERAGRKAQKSASTSTPKPVESHIEDDSGPSSDLLALVPFLGNETPISEPEIGTNSESPPLSPFVEDVQEDEEPEPYFDVELLPRDPGKRKPISNYDVNEQDAVRRGFIALGRCRLISTHEYPQRDIGGKRRFMNRWYDDYSWVEYSVELDAAFCFVCYLFKDKISHAGGDNFVNGGYRNWNMKNRFDKHVGGIKSIHNQAQERYNLFINQKQAIKESFASNTDQYKEVYRSRLTYSLKCLRFLLREGLACRGHDESEHSVNSGNFLKLLKWLAENFQVVDKVVLKNAPKNCRMTSPPIQKDPINSCAKETTKLLMEDLGDYFSILADESSDVYNREQLTLCLRYVDKKGRVVERFLGIVHVEDTCSLTLKVAIESLLINHNLSLSMIRRQGYDGASNMKGHANGLMKLIMDESPSAYYVHCFAHQLQLTLLVVAKENADCIWFFEQIRLLLNVIGNSCKKINMLRVAQAQRVLEGFEIETGTGLNQEMGLSRPGDTRWGSHYRTIMHVISLYPSIRAVLMMVGKDRSQSVEAIQAQTMLIPFQSFEFVFMAHLMLTIFGLTSDLSNALQKGDQDIVNVVDLIYTTKLQL